MSIVRILPRVIYFICGVIFTGNLLGAQTSEATTYYVAKTGSKNNSCTEAQNPATPKLTINDGIDCLTGGSTLIIKPGIYAERIGSGRIPSGSSESNRTVIRSESSGSVTLRPTGTGHLVTMSPTAMYITLEGLILDGSNMASGQNGLKVDGAGPDGAQRIIVRHTEIRNITGAPCMHVRGSFHLFSYLKINGCKESPGETIPGNVGIYFSGRDSIIENSEVMNASHIGVQFYWAKGSSAVVRNTVRNTIFYHNGYSSEGGKVGVTVYGNNNKLYNNIFYDNANGGLNIRGSGNIVRNNISYNNAGSSPEIENTGTNNTLSHNLSTDPKFVNAAAGNFRLRADSPAVNKAMTLSEVTSDFDGIPRPQGGSCDIGAFEYKTAFPNPINLRATSSQ